MAIGEVGYHIDDWQELDSHFLEQVKTQDGYSFLFFSDRNTKGLFWWACGACWTYSDPTNDAEALKQHAGLHVALCKVTRRV
ncbi:hypothetical protein AB0F30_33340 [Streptomyces sp. NPDC029006]|uniref:hypothetical protein n=1 Tax=Streptomyces sp. NPDC029006 TaxID=3155467 RepID=UPI0033CF050B